MRFQFMKWIGLAVFCGATAAWAASATDSNGAWNYSHFSTPLRVLLQRSHSGVALCGILPATVRINGQIKSPRLTAGALVFSPVGQNQVQMVRIPYRPLAAENFELLWAQETPGLEFNQKRYRGRARVETMSGELLLTNILPMEPYLAATVGAEMSPGWKVEALKAQAVAARSYALHRRQHPRHRLFDLDSTTEDQVYLGLSGESARTWAAVRETAGIYLATGGGAANIHYHSRCGGETQTAATAWGNSNTPGQGVVCQFCRRNPYRWSAEWSRAEFAQKLGLPPSPDTHVVEVKQAAGGRVKEVEIASQGISRRLSSETLRRALGYTALKSAQFSFTPSASSVRVEGTGAGHGVGMCQWGAKYLADKGATFLQILSHYYPRNTIARWVPEKGLDRETVAGVGYAHDRPTRLRFSAAGKPNSAFPRFTP
jgi:stage II sporulation protein D